MHQVLGQQVKHPLVSVVDFSKVEFGQVANMKISTGYYSIMLKNLCPGALRYGRNYYDFQDGSLIFVAPNQVVTLVNPDINQDVFGWALSFHPDLIRGTTLFSKMKEYSYFNYSTFEALHLSDKEKTKLDDIVEDIDAELDQQIDKHSKTLIVSAIELFLNYCNRYYDRQFITRTESNKGIIGEFETVLSKYFEGGPVQEEGYPSVRYFADQLNLSPNYLSDLLKKETGKNGTDHIQYHVIDLANNSLLSTQSTVSEIAFQLGFEYPQYFSKMFKKKTGMTPNEFRMAG